LTGEAVSRRRAAIHAADVGRYSRLIEADEDGTVGRFRSLRRDSIDPKIALREGRRVKPAGHGTLVESASAAEGAPIAAG